MQSLLHGSILTREGMATELTQLDRKNLRDFSWSEIAAAPIPERGCLVGQWGRRSGDPLPDLLVVRAKDRADTIAWLSAFFAGLTPLTQWCRLLSQEQATTIMRLEGGVGLGERLGPWVGAILAECSTQSDGSINLKELPGSAALSTATYAAGRAAAVWKDAAYFEDLADRHDELSARMREGPRRLAARNFLPLWEVLADPPPGSRPHDRAMEPFRRLIKVALSMGSRTDSAELLQSVAKAAMDDFDLPELVECARGPQSDRLRALDRLAGRLAGGPRSPATEAILGLGASFVDPGAAVMPDLLRRHAARQPLAPVWLGAFAGAWAPSRVLNDQQGLGRLIAKALLASSDFEAKPAADIAFDELIRWLSPHRAVQRVDVRGMTARTLSVELMPGVTSSFAMGRAEQPSVHLTTRPEPAREPTVSVARHRSEPTLQDVWEGLVSLTQRVASLERQKQDVQPKLDLAPPETKPAKPPRAPRKRS